MSFNKKFNYLFSEKFTTFYTKKIFSFFYLHRIIKKKNIFLTLLFNCFTYSTWFIFESYVRTGICPAFFFDVWVNTQIGDFFPILYDPTIKYHKQSNYKDLNKSFPWLYEGDGPYFNLEICKLMDEINSHHLPNTMDIYSKKISTNITIILYKTFISVGNGTFTTISDSCAFAQNKVVTTIFKGYSTYIEQETRLHVTQFDVFFHNTILFLVLLKNFFLFFYEYYELTILFFNSLLYLINDALNTTVSFFSLSFLVFFTKIQAVLETLDYLSEAIPEAVFTVIGYIFNNILNIGWKIIKLLFTRKLPWSDALILFNVQIYLLVFIGVIFALKFININFIFFKKTLTFKFNTSGYKFFFFLIIFQYLNFYRFLRSNFLLKQK